MAAEGSGQPPTGDGAPATYPTVTPPTQGNVTQEQLLTLLTQQQQQILQLMSSQAGSGGKGGNAGDSTQSDARPQMAKVADAPEFRGNFDVWLKLVRDWEATHYAMDAKQKPGLVLKGLKGDALALARTAVGDKLNDPKSFQVILDTLKTYYGTAAALKQYTEFEKLTSVTNSTDNLEQYIRQYDIRREEAREQGLTLPENISVLQMLKNSRLSAGQVQQILTNAEAIAATHGDATSGGLKMQYVQQVMRSMAQARNLKVGPGRRDRIPAYYAGSHEDEGAWDWGEDWSGQENWDGENQGDDWNAALFAEAEWENEWEDVDVNEEEQNADPEFLAAAALFRKRFAKSRGKWTPLSGKPKGKGGKSQGKGKKGGKSQGAPFPSGKPGGKPRKCKFLGVDESGEPKCYHLKENRKCPFGHPAEDLQKAREKIKAKGAVPTFNAWDASDSFEYLTKKLGTKGAVDSGAKKSVVGEFWLKRYERQLWLKHKKRVTNIKLHSGRPRTFQFGGGCKTSTGRKRIPFLLDLGNGPEWRELYCDTVPGWLPLLYAYDTMKFNKMLLDTDTDTLLAKTAKGSALKVLNAGLDESVGIVCIDLLDMDPTQWKAQSNCGNDETDTVSDGSTCVAALAPVATESQAAFFLEAYQQVMGEDVTETARPETSKELMDSQSQGPSAAGDKAGTASVGAMVTGHTCPEASGNAPESAPALIEVVKPKRKVRRSRKQRNLIDVSEKEGTGCKAVSENPKSNSCNENGDCSPGVTANTEVGANGGAHSNVGTLTVNPGTEADTHTAVATAGQVVQKQKPITKERLKHLHILTKHALSVTALKHLLRRAKCPNLQQALGWYRDIVAECGCDRAEYLHRHRLPRLKLRDISFNDELELDLMELTGRWWLVIVDRGTRFVQAVRLPNKTARATRHAFLVRWVLLFGPPISGLSDCGSEFMNREFLELTDLIRMFKECSPAYASDRHALVERVIRTIREASERSIIGLGRRPSVEELDEIVAIVCNQANNDVQPCGTSAVERAFGRSTYPWLSLLQDPAPSSPENTPLQEVQRAAREAWRETANDRIFQQLLVRQLKPQASIQAPELGQLVYYRRPNPMNDGPVYRGPAEVVGVSHRTEQAICTHGGLVVRVAFEDLKICHVSRSDPQRAAEPLDTGSGGATLGDGTAPQGQAMRFEELDKRDGPPPEPPDENPDVLVVSIPAPRPLEPAPPAATAPPPTPPAPTSAAPPVVSGSAGVEGTPDEEAPPGDEEDDVYTIGVPSEASDTPGDDPLGSDLFVESTPDGDGPPGEMPLSNTVEIEDLTTDPDPLADWLADSPDQVDADAEATAGAEQYHLPDVDVEASEEPAHYGLNLGDRVQIKQGRSWRVGKVFELPADRPDRICLEWDHVAKRHDAHYETLNLAEHEWQLTRQSARLRPTERVSGGDVLAAIAALEAKIDRVSGGERPRHEPSTRSDSRAATVLTALISHTPLKGRADLVPAFDGPECPKRLPELLTNYLKTCLTDLEKSFKMWCARGEIKQSTPLLELLQDVGVQLADAFCQTLYLALAEYLERAPLTTTSDTVALEGFRTLGRLKGDSDYIRPLVESIESLIDASGTDDISPRHVGAVFVDLEQAVAALQGVSRCTVPIPALNAVDTQVYKYTEADLTVDMKKEAAQKELAQFDEFEIWGSDYQAQPPPGSTQLDAKYFDKPKVRVVDGQPTLYAKGRLTPKGFQDPEKHLYRVDSPTVARWVLFVVFSWALSSGWEFVKGDISGAFLQGEKLDRENVWIRLPLELVTFGLVPENRRWRRILKAVYGMNEAPRKWWLAITAAALELGFVKSLIDPCLLILTHEGAVVCILMLYVDDLICAGLKEITANVMESLAGRYPMGQMEKSWELASISYTGMDILFDRKPTGELARVKFNQEAYVKNKFPEAIKELENVLTGTKTTAQDLLTPKQADAFRSGNGKLAWAGNTRPQAAYDISELASAAKVPTASDARKLLKVLRAVLEKASDGITLKRLDPTRLGVIGFGDASFANRGERTQGGFIVLLAEGSDSRSVTESHVQPDSPDSPYATGNVAMFRSTKIGRVCVGTFCAETIEAVETSDATLCVAYLVSELKHGRLPSIAERALTRGFGLFSGDGGTPPPQVWTEVVCDGNGTVTAVHSTKPVSNKRRRIDIALIRELVDHGFAKFRHCSTELQLADGLTKRMPTDPLRLAAVESKFRIRA